MHMVIKRSQPSLSDPFHLIIDTKVICTVNRDYIQLFTNREGYLLTLLATCSVVDSTETERIIKRFVFSCEIRLGLGLSSLDSKSCLL